MTCRNPSQGSVNVYVINGGLSKWVKRSWFGIVFPGMAGFLIGRHTCLQWADFQMTFICPFIRAKSARDT